MKHLSFSCIDIPAAHERALMDIMKIGDDFNVGHGSEETWTKKLSVDIEILHPEMHPLLGRCCPNDEKYLNEYVFRYLWGVEGIPHWGKQPNEHYTYASRMREPVNQTQIAIDRIVENPRDRQITIRIALPQDIQKFAPLIDGQQVLDENGKPAKWEPPCLTIIDFDIDTKEMSINLDIYFRSWDALAGFPINVAGLQLFNEQFVEEVNLRISDVFHTGKIICRSKNLHIYERQYPIVEKLFVKTEDSRRMVKKNNV